MSAFSTRGLKTYISIEDKAVLPWTGATARTDDTTNNPETGTIEAVAICLNSISRDTPQGETISLASFCDPEAQASGAPGAGTLSIGGTIDFCNPGFQELHAALKTGNEHHIIIEFPGSRGHMVIPVEINQYNESFEINAGAVWTGSAVVKTAPTYKPSCP